MYCSKAFQDSHPRRHAFMFNEEQRTSHSCERVINFHKSAIICKKTVSITTREKRRRVYPARCSKWAQLTNVYHCGHLQRSSWCSLYLGTLQSTVLPFSLTPAHPYRLTYWQIISGCLHCSEIPKLWQARRLTLWTLPSS